MNNFISLDYLEMIEDMYDAYTIECINKGEEPKSKQEWYKTIY